MATTKTAPAVINLGRYNFYDWGAPVPRHTKGYQKRIEQEHQRLHREGIRHIHLDGSRDLKPKRLG